MSSSVIHQKRDTMSKTFQYSLPLFLIAASGCVSYSPKPVNMDSVRRAFAVARIVAVDAVDHHPMA